MLVLEVLLTQALVGLVQIFDGKNNCLLKRIQLINHSLRNFPSPGYQCPGLTSPGLELRACLG